MSSNKFGIQWEKYKDIILSMDRDGMSSAKICAALEKSQGKFPSKNTDRTIRKLLLRWRGGAEKGVTPQAKVLIFDLETAPLKANV